MLNMYIYTMVDIYIYVYEDEPVKYIVWYLYVEAKSFAKPSTFCPRNEEHTGLAGSEDEYVHHLPRLQSKAAF